VCQGARLAQPDLPPFDPSSGRNGLTATLTATQREHDRSALNHLVRPTETPATFARMSPYLQETVEDLNVAFEGIRGAGGDETCQRRALKTGSSTGPLPPSTAQVGGPAIAFMDSNPQPPVSLMMADHGAEPTARASRTRSALSGGRVLRDGRDGYPASGRLGHGTTGALTGART
jgi:hypothetical protein